jgi:hypothetical protein
MPRSLSPDYGYTHQKERDRWRPIVAADQASCAELICLMPSRHITPGTAWDLAHDRIHGGYLGPAHRRCNRSEGARHKNLVNRTRILRAVNW